MLTLNRIHSIEYYSDLASEDYYHAGGEPAGRWTGRGAALLGLRGTVETDDYMHILRGFHPNGREALCRQPGKNHQSGWDLTFSAPKSVSIAWARGEEKLQAAIQAAHHSAVIAALDHLEEHAAITRRGNNGKTREATAGLVIATFEHSTSRDLDPQLHTHSLVCNLGPRTDGSWGTLESRDLYLWQRSAGAMYRAELATGMQRLGFATELDRDAFRIVGVPENVCAHFSKRSQAIKKILSLYGARSSASAIGDLVTRGSRNAKTKIDRPALFQQWRETFDDFGYTAEKQKALTKSIPIEPGLESSVLDDEMLVEALTTQKPVFREQEAYQTSAEMALSTGHSAKEASRVADHLLMDGQTVNLGLDERYSTLYTTNEILQSEQKMVNQAKELNQLSDYYVPPDLVERAMAQKPFELTDEQEQAIIDSCQSNHMSIIQGSAGAGKSASMDCVRWAHEAAGYRVIGACVSKAAANSLEKAAKIKAYTITRLLMDIERGRSPLQRDTVLIVDEAGQIGSRQLAPILEAVTNLGAKIILVGEDKQLDAIEHGGCLRYLSRPEIVGTTRIQTIKRQRSQKARENVANLRDGKALYALKNHYARDELNFCDGAEQTKLNLVNAWENYTNSESTSTRESLVLAQSWSDVSDLNSIIRNRFQNQNRVERQDVELDCAVGERVMRYAFSKGERVRFTRNDYRRDFTNGTLGTVIDVAELSDGDVRFSIRTDSNRLVKFRASEYCNEHQQVYLSQAYAMTVYSSQGLTVDGDTFVLYSSRMDRANSYVAGSRHKDNCHWFVNSKEIDDLSGQSDQSQALDNAQRLIILANQMSRDRYKTLATEYLSKDHLYQVERQQERTKDLSLEL